MFTNTCANVLQEAAASMIPLLANTQAAVGLRRLCSEQGLSTVLESRQKELRVSLQAAHQAMLQLSE